VNLIPFEKTPFKIEIFPALTQSKNGFRVNFRLSGEFEKIQPPLSKSATWPLKRKNELWKSTCFEFFLRPIDNSKSTFYFEFNLSPFGEWSVYEFTNLREGMKDSSIFKCEQFSTQHISPKRWELQADFTPNLNNFLPLQLGFASIIEWKLQKQDQKFSYFSLSHTESKPNFHIFESWIEHIK